SKPRVSFPEKGIGWEDIEPQLSEMASGDQRWRDGRVPLYVFKATDEAYEVGRNAYFKFFAENALGGKRAFHSVARMEREVVEMALDLFEAPEGAGGGMTTGGTESIFMAVRACREWARGAKGRKGPFNIVAAASAHPAFDKAGDSMDIPVKRVPLREDFRAEPSAMKAAVDDDTIMIVGSAPCFPHGVVDDIAELGEIALDTDIWLHVDACVGGYLAPFVKRLGRVFPDFDFAVPGVRSLSADLHKFGFAPKPSSTVLYRAEEDFQRQIFDVDPWTYGRMTTSTLVGTRPAGGIAGAWAVFKHLGIDGYTQVAADLMEMVDGYVAGIEAIPDLRMHAKPDLTIINFGSDEVDIFSVAEQMAGSDWVPGLTQRPKGMHAMLSMLHAPIRETYLRDLAAAVSTVRADGSASTLTARY
ncbi:MAG: aspartate aminotransferase family protein, partial [Alphaproteobacteria bacterium]|nr:aspartate aminotransferase family protein [Alphaproteobacteria bacterium]